MRRWPLWVGLGMVAALLLCSVPVVLAVNLLGDGLRDHLDPRLRGMTASERAQ